MRKIIFRGKDIGSNEWVYGHYTEGAWIDPTDGTEVNRHIIHGEDGFLHDIKPETLGQFTGLRDNEGNDIYEGDVVYASRFGKCKVAYDDKSARFEMRDRQCFCWLIYNNETHIIGNIYDNPELIKEDEK